MGRPEKHPDRETALRAFKALKSRIPLQSWTKTVEKYKPKGEGFATLDEEYDARMKLFEEIVILSTVIRSETPNKTTKDVTAADLEYYCHVTNFSEYIPKPLVKLVKNPDNNQEREKLLKKVKGLRIRAQELKESQAQEKVPELPVTCGFSSADVESGVSQALSRLPPVELSEVGAVGKITEKKKKKGPIVIEAELKTEIADLDTETPDDPGMIPPPDESTKERITRLLEQSKKKSEIFSAVPPPPRKQPDSLIGNVCQDPKPDPKVQGPDELSGASITDDDYSEIENEKDQRPIKDYSNKSRDNAVPQDTPVPFGKILYQTQALADTAQKLRAANAIPDSEAPTVKASKMNPYKVMAYNISDSEMKILSKKKKDITADEGRLINKWLNDGLTHAMSVPADLTMPLLLRHINKEVTANQLAVMVTRIENSLKLLRFKDRILDVGVAAGSPDQEELEAAQGLSESIAYESLVTCIGPVIDYLHSSVEEVRANYEVPIKDLEQLFKKMCLKLDNHNGSYEHLAAQMQNVVETRTNMSMEDISKGMVNASLNKKVTMATLSQASGYETPELVSTPSPVPQQDEDIIEEPVQSDPKKERRERLLRLLANKRK